MGRPKAYETQIDRRTHTLFVIACEGEKSEEIYLRFITQGLRRVNILPLPTPGDGRSAPLHLLERLRDWKSRNRLESVASIRLWMVLDADHHFVDRHAIGTHAVLGEALRNGIFVAVSNPRFELWLVLHFEDVTAPCQGQWCEERLRFYLGAYNHSAYDPSAFKMGLGDALQRGDFLNIDPSTRLPANPGTQLHHLMRALITA